jgi:hypothetical protein
MRGSLLTLVLVVAATPAHAGDDDCLRELDRLERDRSECARVLVRAGSHPARAAADCAVRHPARCKPTTREYQKVREKRERMEQRRN